MSTPDVKMKEDPKDQKVKDSKDKDKEEEPTVQDEILKIADLKFALSLPDAVLSSTEKEAKKKTLEEEILKKDLTRHYQWLCKRQGWKLDESQLATMKANNAQKLKELDQKIEDAKKNEGDTEVRDALGAKAQYLAIIGEKKAAFGVYEETYEKTVGMGRRIDLVLTMIRLSLAHNDLKSAKTHIDRAKTLVEQGGDWERRNLLGVYEATYLVLRRELKEAAGLFLKSIATFTANELYTYETLIFYTVIAAIVSLDRVTLRDKVVRSPEILTVIRDIPHLKPLLFALYQCQYNELFRVLPSVIDMVKADRYWSSHVGYVVREIRIVAYSQFLESYRAVTFTSMAKAFGVSVPFLDRELSRFISAGRLNCKIDKVSGIVETKRPDARNTQYLTMIKQGDLLLNRIQNLTKVLSHMK